MVAVPAIPAGLFGVSELATAFAILPYAYLLISQARRAYRDSVAWLEKHTIQDMDEQLARQREQETKDITQEKQEMSDTFVTEVVELFENLSKMPAEQLQQRQSAQDKRRKRFEDLASPEVRDAVADARKRIMLQYVSHLEVLQKRFPRPHLEFAFNYLLDPDREPQQASLLADLYCEMLDKLALRSTVVAAFEDARQTIDAFYTAEEFAADRSRMKLSVAWDEFQQVADEIQDHVRKLRDRLDTQQLGGGDF